MKSVGMMVLVLAMALYAVAAPVNPSDKLVFLDLHGRDVVLVPDDVASARVLFFFTNTCPIARRYVPRMLQLAADFRARGVEFIAVNVGQDDALVDVARFAMDYGFTFSVVKDPACKTVKLLGITRTPEVAVLDKNLVTVYKGRIDDQYRLGGARPEATRHELADALVALLEGRPVPVSDMPAEGCVVTTPAADVSIPEETVAPDRSRYNVEMPAIDVGGEGAVPGLRTWPLSSVSNGGWVKALRVDGSFTSARLYFFDKETKARHILAGALRAGRPLRWNKGEAMSIPAGAVLHLDTLGENLQVPVVRLETTDIPPDWAIACTASFYEQTEVGGTTPLSIRVQYPLYGQVRAIMLDETDYGTALSVEHLSNDGSTHSLLSVPVVDSPNAGPYALTEQDSPLAAPGSLQVTLNRPGYLSWPSNHPERSELALKTFLYWATRM